MTPVLFRIDKHGAFKGELTAVFPTLPGSPGLMSCYAHLGQHSSCGRGWLASTRPAKPAEYADLQRELVRAGYDDLKVYARIQPWMHDARREAEGR